MVNDSSKAGWGRKRQWIRIATLMLIGGTLLGLAAWLPTLSAANIAQNSASISAWVGAYELADIIQGSSAGEDRISAEMLLRATLYGLGDGDRLVSFYLDAEGRRIGQVGSGIPQAPRGIEAVATVRVHLLGLDGWSVTRRAQSSLQVEDGDEQVIRIVPPSPTPKLFSMS